jgi:hypothetical protein
MNTNTPEVSNLQKLQSRIDELSDGGLLDLKIDVDHAMIKKKKDLGMTDEEIIEEFAAEMLRMLEACSEPADNLDSEG